MGYKDHLCLFLHFILPLPDAQVLTYLWRLTVLTEDWSELRMVQRHACVF